MRALALGVLALTGCATILPMQTASVVDRGHLRVGGQLSAAGFCGVASQGVLGLTSCTDYPDGIPLPELRVNGRYGFARRFDVGGSVQALGQIFAPEKSMQLGVTADLKGELLRVPTSGPTHIVSAGVLGGTAMAGRLSQPLWLQAEWGLPVFYGLQFEHVELVANVTFSQRFTRSPSVSPSSEVSRIGFALGIYKRDPAGIGVQLAYVSDVERFLTGAIQLQVGLFFDVL